MKKITKKTKIRITLLSVGFVFSMVFFVSTIFTYITQIEHNNNQISQLNNIYNSYLEEEDLLKKEAEKLKNPEYLARYTREKFLYSKDNEIIIKIEE